MSRSLVWLWLGVFSAIVLAGGSLWWSWSNTDQLQQQLRSLPAPTVSPTPMVSPLVVIPGASPSADLVDEVSVEIDDVQTLAQLKTELQKLQERVLKLEKNLTGKTAAPTSKSNGVIREYVVYLGSGSTTDRNWTVIPGAGVTLNSATYRNIREVRFEAGMSIISGEVHARLYDRDTQTPFYNSEVSNNTSIGQWQTSAPLHLTSGSKYYTVQLKSSNGEMANLIGARLKILAD